MYKFSKNMLPELFEIFFCNVASVHEHSKRSACLSHIYVKFKGTTRGQKAFSYSGARIWILILSHIETNCAIGTFKKLFAKLLLNSKEDLLSILNLDKHGYSTTLMSMIFPLLLLIVARTIVIFLISQNSNNM